MQQDEPSPNPQYDFILKSDQNTASGKFNFSKIPRPIFFGGIVILGLVLLSLFYVAFGGSSSKYQSVVGVVGRGQEIVRVSTLAQSQTKDEDTQNIAATTIASLNSDKNELLEYLKDNGVKVSQQEIALYTNKKTDSELSTAAQSGKAESAYDAYLKSALEKYTQDLKAAAVTVGPKGHQILDDAYNSAILLLTSPQLKTVNS